jgi:3'-phosphoadenosine 5'-phosphosulfate sulfotransferase (PAPS reductase)/FAD synthetase
MMLQSQTTSTGAAPPFALIATTRARIAINRLLPSILDADEPVLTVLSFGAGQDSTAILYKLIFDAAFRQRFAPGRFIVVFSDTGNEHDETYDHLREVEELCQRHGVEFYWLRPEHGFHVASWQSLNEHHDELQTIGSVAFNKTCSDNLKIKPIYKFLDAFVSLQFKVALDAQGAPRLRKKGLYEFAANFGKVRVLVGIAQGEESRVADPAKELHVWKRETVEIVYPLLEVSMNREACQTYIKSLNLPVPVPSNCKRCMYLSESELLYLWRTEPAEFLDWARQERVKLNRNRDQKTNATVRGKRTLFEALYLSIEKFGHLTDAELLEMKMSHGHCVASKY